MIGVTSDRHHLNQHYNHIIGGHKTTDFEQSFSLVCVSTTGSESTGSNRAMTYHRKDCRALEYHGNPSREHRDGNTIQ